MLCHLMECLSLICFQPVMCPSCFIQEERELLTLLWTFLLPVAQMFVLNQCILLGIQKDYFYRCSYRYALLSVPLSLSHT